MGGGVIGIIFLVIQSFFTGDINPLLEQIGHAITSDSQLSGDQAIEEDSIAAFASVVLADNEDVWSEVFTEQGKSYQPPVMVLFRDFTESGCGSASKQVGPFYCSQDEKLYLDLSFFDDLKKNYGGEGGDFAIAYVIGHEVGHHVQHLLGVLDEVHTLQSGMNEKSANELSVRLELQADFLAGVWANRNQKMKNVLEDGDIQEALSAASAVGDDHLQNITQGYIVPDAFTHGTSAQRKKWFLMGFKYGDLSKGDLEEIE